MGPHPRAGVAVPSLRRCRVTDGGNAQMTSQLNMPNPHDRNDSVRQTERFIAAKAEAAALHDQAMLLGYDVGVTTTSEVSDRRVHVGPLGHEPRVSLIVRHVDQPWEYARTFATVGEVKERLKRFGHFAAVLPRPRGQSRKSRSSPTPMARRLG